MSKYRFGNETYDDGSEDSPSDAADGESAQTATALANLFRPITDQLNGLSTKRAYVVFGIGAVVLVLLMAAAIQLLL